MIVHQNSCYLLSKFSFHLITGKSRQISENSEASLKLFSQKWKIWNVPPNRKNATTEPSTSSHRPARERIYFIWFSLWPFGRGDNIHVLYGLLAPTRVFNRPEGQELTYSGSVIISECKDLTCLQGQGCIALVVSRCDAPMMSAINLFWNYYCYLLKKI